MKPAPRKTLAHNLVAIALSVFISAAYSSAQYARPAQPLGFDEARAQLAASAPSLKAAQARLAGKRETEASLKSLSYPGLTLEAHYIKYQKTINDSQLNIDSLSINGAPLPLAALGIHSFEARISQNALVPAATATWTLYSGGQITATKRAASALAEQAGAQADAIRESLDLELVRAYFGQQLAARVLDLRQELLDGMSEHLDNAIKLEKGGLITKGQRLQAQVAHDAAKRGFDAAAHTLESARIALSALLNTDDTFTPTTPLFVIKKPLAPVVAYVAGARERNPQVRSIDSLRRAAEQNAEIEKSRWKPKVLAFGSYNFFRNGETLTDMDWTGGIAVRWSVFDKIDRRKSYAAARHAVTEAAESAQHVRMMADAGARQAYDAVASALRQFELLESNLEAARENLRVQELSFREGQGISTDVTTARIALTNVLVERAVAACQFTLELAKLLHASGQMDQFAAYVKQADAIIP